MTHMSKSIPTNEAWVINEYIFALHLRENLKADDLLSLKDLTQHSLLSLNIIV